MLKSSSFWKKPWNNPFKKFDFLDVFETSLFCSKKYPFLSRILENDLFCLLCLKKQHGNKLDFLIKTWTYPFEKLDFSDVLETSLFWSHKIHSNWGTDRCDIPCLQGIDNFTQCLDTLLRCKDYFMVFTSYEKKIHIFKIYLPLMPQYPHTKFPDWFPLISLRTSLENLIEDQSIFPLVIDDVWIKRKLMRVTLKGLKEW